MSEMVRFAKRLWADDEGATAIEYGLLAALVAVAIILALQAVSGALNDTFNSVATELEAAQPAGDDDG